MSGKEEIFEKELIEGPIFNLDRGEIESLLKEAVVDLDKLFGKRNKLDRKRLLVDSKEDAQKNFLDYISLKCGDYWILYQEPCIEAFEYFWKHKENLEKNPFELVDTLFTRINGTVAELFFGLPLHKSKRRVKTTFRYSDSSVFHSF
jgi:hypothetical protein